LVVVGRLLLLLAPAAALATAVVHARSHDRADLASGERYVCPMHPEIQSGAPGDCPICNMALVAVRETEDRPSGMPGGRPVVATAEARVVAREVRAAAWVGADGDCAALLYRDDLVGLAAEEPARFFGERSPNMPIDAHVMTAEPTPVDPSLVKVRFRLDPPTAIAGDTVDPMGVGSLLIDVRARKLLVVPTSAVLHSANGPYVLASGGEAEGFTRRAVEVGRVLDSGYVGALRGRQAGATVILSGLHEGERVISGHAFFVDAERRLREARGTGEEASR
jgi:Heavy metal binding domain